MRRQWMYFAVGGLVMLAGCVSNPPASEMAAICKSLEGEWTGVATGRIEGAMRIVFRDNCNYSWWGAFSTDGALTHKAEGEFYYQNQAGSRGIVTWDRAGQKLTYRNTYTGNNYVIEVVKAAN